MSGCVTVAWMRKQCENCVKLCNAPYNRNNDLEMSLKYRHGHGVHIGHANCMEGMSNKQAEERWGLRRCGQRGL